MPLMRGGRQRALPAFKGPPGRRRAGGIGGGGIGGGGIGGDEEPETQAGSADRFARESGSTCSSAGAVGGRPSGPGPGPHARGRCTPDVRRDEACCRASGRGPLSLQVERARPRA